MMMARKPQALAFERHEVDELLEDLQRVKVHDSLYPLDDQAFADFKQWCVCNELLARYLPREQLEEHPEYLQILPYVLIKYGPRLVGYNRAATTDEGRLSGKFSIGVGGHVEMKDWQQGRELYEMWACQATREIDEELDIYWEGWEEDRLFVRRILDTRPLALILDESNMVGRCHLGVVYLLDIHDSEADPELTLEVVSREPDQVVSPRLMHLEALRNEPNAESWTALLLAPGVLDAILTKE
jgi:predicted NUDIX family phosphoesterase